MQKSDNKNEIKKTKASELFEEWKKEWKNRSQFGISNCAWYMAKYYVTAYIFSPLAIIGTIYLFNWLLNGHFFNYGPLCLEYLIQSKNGDELTNPMDKFLPTITKCGFRKFGLTASVERSDAMCMLLQNE